MRSSPGGRPRRADARPKVLRALELGLPVAEPTVIVAAHPDDETIGLGARLAQFEALTLVHLTDGAPEAPQDRRRAGFASREAYAAARAAELEEALARLGARPKRTSFGLRDQDVARALPDIVRRLEPRLAGAAVVITHAYEGGHPDHDAAAFSVWAACARLAQTGRAAPLRLEFAGYHLAWGEPVSGRFWPDREAPDVAAQISPAELARKRAALAAFRSQAPVIAGFDAGEERYREAPAYDFCEPPPPGEALYDGFGWAMTSARWRSLAAAALRALGLEGAAWA